MKSEEITIPTANENERHELFIIEGWLTKKFMEVSRRKSRFIGVDDSFKQKALLEWISDELEALQKK